MLYAASDCVNAPTAALYVSNSGSPNVFRELVDAEQCLQSTTYLNEMVFERCDSSPRVLPRVYRCYGEAPFQRV